MGYNGTHISFDGTHHLKDGNSLYNKRFNAVQSFHDPGIAPVEDDTGCYYIDIKGNDLFGKRFLKAYGFYESIAAAADISGWYHINLEGNPVYGNRFEWVGNFQDGLCTVRDRNGAYYHIIPSGEPVYQSRFIYAGDYRYGIAVVFEHTGHAYHIFQDGTKVHENSFVDLDVFHKGFARAKDMHGWTHINMRGEAAYSERYDMVEPFYNGHARVMDKNGIFLIINERGEIVHKIGSVQILEKNISDKKDSPEDLTKGRI
jgi:hypothetical protein